MFALTRRSRHAVNVWPAFVEALASLLVVFVLGQVALTDMLSGRNRALDKLTQQVNAPAEMLSLEREQGKELRTRIERLSAQLGAATSERDAAAAQRQSMTSRAGSAEAEAGQLRSHVDEASKQVETEKGRVDVLTQQVAALWEELARISKALDVSEEKVKSQKTQIAELGKQLAQLAEALKTVTRKIPAGIDWVLRIDGHTDQRPIHTAQFPSNWDLSVARSLSVVAYLEKQGIPPKRLAAAGFGEFQPIDKADTPQAGARNRRIEIKLTQP